eukprot:gene11276-biopygen7754
MLWMFAARPADITRLRVRSIAFSEPDANRNIPTQITIREGKGAKFRGPYPVASVLLPQQATVLQHLMQDKLGSQLIFKNAAEVREQTLRVVHKVCPDATLQSLRKGAVLHLAHKGVPEDQLMRITGHTQVNTLRKYLGYGRQLTAEGVAAQANAGLLHPEQSS